MAAIESVVSEIAYLRLSNWKQRCCRQHWTDNEIFLSGLQALEGHGMVVLVYGRHFNLGRATGLFHHDVLTFTMQVLALLCVATARVGVPGETEFVERHVYQHMGRVLTGTAVGAERARTRSFGPGSGIPLRSFSFPSQFALSSGELGVGRPCCAAQADRDLSETPPRHGEVVDNGRHECGPSFAEGFPLASSAVDALRWTPTVASIPLREKVCPHSTCTHPQRAHSAHTHDSARCATRHVHCHMHVCSLWRCGLVSACE